jgi:hypothetical protein
MNRWYIYDPTGAWENVIEADSPPALPPGYVASLTPPEPPPPPPVQLTPREFMSRLTLTRQEAITAAAVAAAVQGNAAPLNWLFRMLGAVYVDPAEPETVGGVTALEMAGLITAEEAAALLA